MGCLYMNKELADAISCVNQQVLCYLTACEREQHCHNTAEKAITDDLMPRVEELLAEDAMNGGEHPMARKSYQGQTGLFFNGNAYLVNYTFAKGAVCEAYHKAGVLPVDDARTVQYESDRLLDMTEDLCGGMKLWDFAKKYRRNIPLIGRDKLINGLGLALQRTAERGFPENELVDLFAYQNGVTLWVTADKKVMDSTLYMFIMSNCQALNMGRPRIDSGGLYAGAPVARYDVTYSFRLADPQRSKDRMKLEAQIDLVYAADEHSRKVQDITVEFTEEESAKICAYMKRRYFPVKMPGKPHGVPVSLGEEFCDNYYLEHGTEEQKRAVRDKWASTDATYRHMLELAERNKKGTQGVGT